jgi:DNA-binding HxlR family transcriptional regulator
VGYGQFCPVARGAELFAERWTPLIVRELLNGSHRFNELRRGLPHISRTVLSERLSTLERSGLVERRSPGDGNGHGYYLTAAGEELKPVVQALGSWGYKWLSRDLKPDNLDADLLMWFLHRRIRVENLPADRVVVCFRFRGVPRPYWLVLERPSVDLCLSDPGYEVDLRIEADVEALTRVYLGHVTFAAAARAGANRLDGAPRHRKAFPSWLGTTVFSGGGSGSRT